MADINESTEQTGEPSERKLSQALGKYIQNARDLNAITGNQGTIGGYAAYYGEAFGNEREGLSDHITRDVFDAVESSKARLLSAFAGTRNVVHYKPTTAEDVQAAAFRNALVKDVFWNDNNGYKLLHDALHDGLLCRWLALKWYWHEDIQSTPEEVTADPNTIAIVAQEAVANGMEINGVRENEDGNHTLFATKTVDRSRVKIEVIAPERVLIENGAESQEDANFVGEEMRLTGGELVEMGVDPEAITAIDSLDGNTDTTTAERHKGEASGTFETDSPTKEGQLHKVYNCFVRIDLQGDGTTQLYQTLSDYDGRLLLDPVPVDAPQIVIGSLIPQPHKVSGLAMAELVEPIQKASSTVMRQYIDHLNRVNTGRIAADMSMVRNPRNLIENHVGGVIDVEFTENGAAPLQDIPQPQLSPVTGVVLEELKLEKEQRGGMSRLAQGLNSDAVSNQNADSLIERLTTMSSARVMMIARHFAELVLKPLFDGVFKLATQMDQKPRLLEIGGQAQQVSPQDLAGDYSLSIEMTVTEEESTQRAQTLLLMHNTFMADPDAAFLYPTANRFALYGEVLKAMGETPSMFLQDPNNEQGQQTFSQMQAQNQEMSMALDQSQQQIQFLSQQLSQMQAQLLNRQAEQMNKDQLAVSKITNDKREQDRKDVQFAHEVVQDKREFELEKQQERGVTLS